MLSSSHLRSPGKKRSSSYLGIYLMKSNNVKYNLNLSVSLTYPQKSLSTYLNFDLYLSLNKNTHTHIHIYMCESYIICTQYHTHIIIYIHVKLRKYYTHNIIYHLLIHLFDLTLKILSLLAKKTLVTTSRLPACPLRHVQICRKFSCARRDLGKVEGAS